MPTERNAATPMADRYFSEEKVCWLADRFKNAWDGFDSPKFNSDVMGTLYDCTLKDRISLIARSLDEQLPGRFDRAMRILVKALPPPLNPTLRDDDFGDFIIAPLGEVVVSRSSMMDNVEKPLQVLREVTKRFTMEWALRPFINKNPNQTLEILSGWCDDKHYHVRRLVSEGTRPRLPWGKSISMDPLRTIPLLERLHADPTRFVTRSVANHLNDLSRIHCDTVVELLRDWHQRQEQQSGELLWMTKHAMRTCIKDGDSRAMQLLGYRQPPNTRLKRLNLPANRISMDRDLVFEVALSSSETEPIIVDYRIDFGIDGERPRSKVFKLKTFSIEANEKVVLQKRHRMKSNATTFRLRPGSNRLTILINGVQAREAVFELIDT